MPKRDVHPVGAPTWIELMTSDPAKSKAFYGELFGWTSEEAGEELGNYITFSKDEQPVGGGMRNTPETGRPDVWSVYLTVEDISKTLDAVPGHSGQVIVPAMQVGQAGAWNHGKFS